MRERDWPLGVVLTATHDKLMHKPFGDVQEFYEWYVGYPIWTHQLPRIGEEHGADIRRAAGLEGDDVQAAMDSVTRENYLDVLGMLASRYGDTVSLAPLAPSTRTAEPVDPVEELTSMVGPEKVIVVQAGD